MVHGYLSHADPLLYDPNNYRDTVNGFGLFLTQVCIIIILCLILGRAFQALGQPMVLGELLAGVLLGPSAFGNIPGFTETIIPPDAVPLLKVTAGIGLSLFLFLVGLETDTELMARYWRKVAMITLPGMAIPFAVSIGIARLVWNLETDQTASFTTFFLFLATTMAVTSLSVLSRIMAELKILQTTLGCITIAAGYTLLALASALSGGGKQITALYELLAAAGLAVTLWFVFRPLMQRELRRIGFDMSPDSTDEVPEYLLVIVVIGALGSAFFTDIIGVHPIVGSFTFGVCCPHGHFGVRVTEAIETPIMIVLLPLYFVTAGLTTDVKLLNTGTTWGLIILIVVGVFISKFGATALAAKAAGMDTSEAMCVASLMQSKAVIELVILSAGRDAGVIPTRVFSMMMIVFLTTTLTVRPLSRYIYFSRQEAMVSDSAALQIDGVDEKDAASGPAPISSSDFPITVAITSVNPDVSALMALLKLLGGGEYYEETKSQIGDDAPIVPLGRVVVDLLRLLPLEYTTSTILRLINLSGDDRRRDDLLESLKMFAVLNDVPTSASLSAIRHLSIDGGTVTSRIATQHSHSRNGNLRPAADTFPVPEAEMTAFAARSNQRAQLRLRVSAASTDSASELGAGMTVVTWEGTRSSRNSSFWLGTAAAATGLTSVSSTDEDAYVRASADAYTLPARLFDEVRSATGVLLERNLLSSRHGYRGSALSLCSPNTSTSAREAAEMALALPRTSRARVFVPFFGGNDDRAAVELCKRMATAGQLEGIVVSLASIEGAHLEDALRMEEMRRGNPSVQREGKKGNTTDEAQHFEEGLETINLQTIHRAEAKSRDARFLFQQATLVPTAETPPSTEQAGLSPVSGVSGGPMLLQQGHVWFVTIPTPSSANNNNDAALRIEPVLQMLIPLMDPSKDFLLLGRGKLAQRPREFRAEVEGMYHAVRRRGKENAPVDEEDGQKLDSTLDEIRKLGRTLGAAVEGALLCGARTDILVVQACRE